ncbi:histidine kinase [Actinocorallia sp. API 0066]|uniref:sensor histidine kinase n=1 Tax=Actinocorallia sp. API 0066 TaxID=2896846 RepID=UPI001E3532FA|nr:histidine kinase [Actinocorallia sp. API 0066]MCD0452923.1 histidine kinase [Actinocorallia sp. API 0066]
MGHVRRTRREWAIDLGLVALAALVTLQIAAELPLPGDPGPVARNAEYAAAALGCAALLLRRRWPAPLAIVLMLAASQAHYLLAPVVVAVYTAAATARARAVVWVAVVAVAPVPAVLLRLPDYTEERLSSALTYLAAVVAAFGWGLFRRSRVQLLASLRERAELAEARAELRAEGARREAREEIAREMHDVLGHRLSLLSVYAGALEFNAGASHEEVARAAGLIRENARLALSDLHEVIGLLRADPDEADRPQPDLSDLARLVGEARAAGAEIRLEGPPNDAVPPPAIGRAAYRIVQEALTNARKHAPDEPVTVAVEGGPGEGLTVRVSNPLPEGWTPPDDDGHGLLGLAERAKLAGGRLTAGPAGDAFRVSARLPWPVGKDADERVDG